MIKKAGYLLFAVFFYMFRLCPQKEKKVFKKKQEIKKVQVKTVSFNKSDDLEEKKLIALQNRATELNNRIKKRGDFV